MSEPERLADLLPAVVADLAARHHQPRPRLELEVSETPKHAAEDGCYFCASDDELAAGLTGQVRRTLHMQLPVEACPNVDPADFAYPASPVLPSGGTET